MDLRIFLVGLCTEKKKKIEPLSLLFLTKLSIEIV